MFRIAILAFLVSTPAFAQAPEDPAFCTTALSTVINQRNTAQNEAAQAQTQLALANRKLVDLQKQVDDLTPKKPE